MLRKELQPVAIYFDGTPGMRFNQFGKVSFQLLSGELVGTAVIALCNPANRACVDINGFVTQALKLQCPEVATVQCVESDFVRWIP